MNTTKLPPFLTVTSVYLRLCIIMHDNNYIKIYIGDMNLGSISFINKYITYLLNNKTIFLNAEE